MDVVATRSEDPHTQVGCVILDTKGRIVSVGYNGLPRGLSTRDFPLDDRPEKYAHVVHADLNAILNGERHRLEGATMYLPFPPCADCAQAIIQAGIGKVIYRAVYRSQADDARQDLAKSMLEAAQIPCFRPTYYEEIMANE